ncbi:MAG: chemotaxis protein CheD [Oligoflexales bacterium]|nr:chemotaxis protein CheD [Oligoflexales bacterium]
MTEKLIVGIGECHVSNVPSYELKTYALGSCIAVIFIDPKVRGAGLVHIALPDSSISPEKARTCPGYFVDTGILYLISQMKRINSAPHAGYIVKIVGGACVIRDESHFLIGERNINAAKKILWNLNIPIYAMDIGGDFSRTVTVILKTGRVMVSTSNGKEWSV